MKQAPKTDAEFAEWLRYRNGVQRLAGVSLAQANQEADLHVKRLRAEAAAQKRA